FASIPTYSHAHRPELPAFPTRRSSDLGRQHVRMCAALAYLSHECADQAVIATTVAADPGRRVTDDLFAGQVIVHNDLMTAFICEQRRPTAINPYGAALHVCGTLHRERCRQS